MIEYPPVVLPHSLAVVSNLLDISKAPAGPFDPEGNWDHRYDCWTGIRQGRHKPWPSGSFCISRTPGAAAAELTVSQERLLPKARRVERLHARITCRRDALSTPIAWTVESAIFDGDGKPVDYTQTSTRAKAESAYVRLSGSAQADIDLPDAYTGGWCLFDAVQRLPLETGALRFDLLEELELVKRGHRLEYRQCVELHSEDQVLRLHEFQHVGAGIVPYTYWLDDQHRLLIAVSGVGAFIMQDICRPVEALEVAQ